MDSSLSEDCTMEIVMKNIYTSCDPENANLVPASKLIEFIKPYMLEDLSALNSLRHSLDPENNNACVSSEKFFEVMNEWAKKITNSSDEDSDFNRTPSALQVVDEKQLPYIQSTPRASFGQKLLSCEGLLNLSNVSGYSLSTSTQTKDSSLAGQEKTILEEEIKRLEHHLHKVSNEMVMVKLQLTATEEQNETLQADLDRCKTRLQSEQQLVEHLQNDKRYNDELRDELNATKRQVEELSKKLTQFEKDNHHLLDVIKQNEDENSKLERRCEELSRREQDAKKEIITIKTELDLSEQQITTILKINEELSGKLNQQRDTIDQLTNENELLEHQRMNLEKALRDNLSARRDSLVFQYKTCLADSSSLPNIDQSSEEECFFNIQSTDCKSPGQDSLHTEISQVVDEKGSMPHSYSLMSFERNEKLMELEDDSNTFDVIQVYKDEINELKIKNDSIQSKLELSVQDNERLCEQVSEMNEKVAILEQDLKNLLVEKQEKEVILEQVAKEKKEIEGEVEEMKQKLHALTDENNNLLEKETLINSTLEQKSNIMSKLEQNLSELKREFENLQMENLAKEKELSARFNFESAFKKNQVELNEKIKEIANLAASNEKLEELLAKSTASNQELKESLNQAQLRLKDQENKSKQVKSLNENISLTTAQVQVHLDRKNDMIKELVDLNKKFETNIDKLQQELQNKIGEVTELRDNLKADMEIKNIMWRDNKELQSQLDAQIEENKKMLVEIKEIKESHEKKYEDLLTSYNKEVEKNCALFEELNTVKGNVSSVMKKYNEEVEKNHKLNAQVTVLRIDINTIRESQKDNKEIGSSESTKNRSFDKQKLAINRLKEKLEHAEEKLQFEVKKRQNLEKLLEEKKDFEDKYLKTVSELEKVQQFNLLEKQKLQNIISELSVREKEHEQRYLELESKSKEGEGTLSLKLSQLENQNTNILTELRNSEFAINNARLEIESYKNLFKNADQKVQDLSKTMSAIMHESNNKQKIVQLLSSNLVEKDNQIVSLSSKLAEQDVEVTRFSKELTNKNDMISTLEKENKSLQDMLSKSDDSKEKELLDIEQKLKNARRLLQCSEMEHNLIEKKLSNSKEEYETVCGEISKYKNVVTKGRTELSRASDLVLCKWQEVLVWETVYKELLLLKEWDPSEKSEICVLDNTIKIAVLLLELLATRAPIPTEGADCSLLNLKTSTNQYSQSPSRLTVSRPASPDSPSIDVGDAPPQLINANVSNQIYANQLPDNHISETCPYISEDSYHTARNEFSFIQGDYEFTSFQETFPNISDTFLEKLGLHENNSKQNLTKEQTEEIFTTFAIQIALDSRDIKERLQKQKDRCVEQHEKFLSIVRDVSQRLRDHRCIGAADPICPVFVLLEDMKFLLRDLTHSTEQLGILTCENRMMRCWNLVTNYMAFLKQGITKLSVKPIIQDKKIKQYGTFKNLGIKFKNTLLNLGNKCEVECTSSITPTEAAEVPNRRFKCWSVKNSVITVLFISFIILILLISIHWQCRMTSHENQICILDDFIKKIQIGDPPY